MDKLKTATGKMFECDFLSVIPNPNRAYLRICGTPITTVAEVFGNPEETKVIQYGDSRLEQYTRLLSIVIEDSAIRVTLTKE